jgi:hypothetical protein
MKVLHSAATVVALHQKLFFMLYRDISNNIQNHHTPKISLLLSATATQKAQILGRLIEWSLF